jgi:hypothetical protein
MGACRYFAYFAAALLCVMLSVAPALAGGGGPCGTGSGHPVPEPAALALLGVGVAGILALRKRVRRNK